MSIAYEGRTRALHTPTEPLRFPPASVTEELAQIAPSVFSRILPTVRAVIEALAVLLAVYLLMRASRSVQTDGDAALLALECGALLTIVFWRFGR